MKSRNTFTFITLRLFALIFVGVLIHLLQNRDLWMMLILLIYAVNKLYRKRKDANFKIYFFGFGITMIFGVLAEIWGISNGLWEYHELPNGREFPYWLPMAWGLAFTYLYSFELYFVEKWKLKTLNSKILLAMIIAMTLPVIGEIVTVQLGVWTYYGKFQFFGIPLYAIILLTLFHTGTYLMMCYINLYWKIPDPVFTIENKKRVQIKK